MNAMIRVVLSGVALWCLSGTVARAQTRVVVQEFSGPSASQVRDAVVDVLEDRAVEVVSTKVANAQARRSGAELDSESGRVRVAKKLRLNAFVAGRVEKGRRNVLKVHLTVYGARDGMEAGELRVSATKRQIGSELRDSLWSELGPAIRGETEAAEPAEPAPEPEFVEAEPPGRQAPTQPKPNPWQQTVPQETDQEVAVAPDLEPEGIPVEPIEDDPQPSTAPALDINVGARFGGRNFSYNDPLPGLRKYGMSMSPNVRLHLRWFPVAHFDDGTLSNIGLDLRGELLVGVSSENRAGQRFDTSGHNFGVGLRGRLPFRTLELGAVLGYGVHTFALTATSKADPDVPDTSYGFLRAGIDARIAIYGMFYTQLAAAFLLGLSHGEIAADAWFPHTSGHGVEAELAAGLAFTKVFGAELALSLQRYFMSFDPQPRDPGVRGPGRVAGGAVDQYLSMRVAMVVRI